MSVAPHDGDDAVVAAAGFIICHRKAMMAADTFSPLSLSLSFCGLCDSKWRLREMKVRSVPCFRVCALTLYPEDET